MPQDAIRPDAHSALPVPSARPGAPARAPEPVADTAIFSPGTTYDPHDRVPHADAESEC